VDQANKEYPETRTRASTQTWQSKPHGGNLILAKQIREPQLHPSAAGIRTSEKDPQIPFAEQEHIS